MSAEQVTEAEAKPMTITNVAHGQFKQIFESLMEEIHKNIIRLPAAEHDLKLGLKFFMDEEKGIWRVRASGKVSAKESQSVRGHDMPIVISRNGMFTPKAGKQMTIEGALKGEEDDEE